ncbi:MAG: glycosyltransferase involved in cell wall biosynthesis [Flavobacteriaceae bacterium]|jgi:glycosyltransferase involved in cell wall biosynthesis
MKILWLAPNFNHYKARFLNHLAEDVDVDLTILSGSGRTQMGDQELEGDWSFAHRRLNVSKKEFGYSKQVNNELKLIFADFDWVLIPAEKKNLLLFLYAMKLRKTNKTIRLFSYNHPILKSKDGKITWLDKLLTKFYYKKLDRIIFYTEQSHDWAIKNKLIDSKKAFWANNTLDNIEIQKYYTYQLPPLDDHQHLLFIGRLIPSKRIGELIEYFNRLKTLIPGLELDIIGDGPESHIIKKAIENRGEGITWHGSLVNEDKIAPIMSKASIVFIPGHSGLSINHAFAYGRPYISLQGPSHAPELDYITDGENGYILTGDFDSNIKTIKDLLINRRQLEQFCNNAKAKSEYLSVENWVQQLKSSLLYE